MTERAKRAAAVLGKRGWSIAEHDGTICHQCGVPAHNFTSSTLDDLEAAISAAVDDERLYGRNAIAAAEGSAP